ncbi:MAG: hypothetical protein V4576_04405 [Patescibacteria group bacterium]
MDNTTPTQTTSSSTTLIVGIILGILILGGIFLYMRGNTSTSDNAAPAQDGIEADINIPIRNDAEQTPQQ